MLRASVVVGVLAAFAALTPVTPAEGDGAVEPLAQVWLDIDGDGLLDLARLVASTEGADLEIFLGVGQSRLDPSRRPTFSKKGAALYSPGASDVPELLVKNRSALVVKTGKSISRDNWRQSLTIISRSGVFMVAGVAFEEIEADAERVVNSCDVNFLSGRGLRKGRPVKGRFAPIRLEDWSDQTFEKICIGH